MHISLGHVVLIEHLALLDVYLLLLALNYKKTAKETSF